MLCLMAGVAVAQEAPQLTIVAPSGQAVALLEAIWEEAPAPGEAPQLRLRFLAPAIAPGPDALGFGEVEGDFLHLCETVALPLAAERPAGRVVISLSDRAVPFGETEPDAVQFFDAFLLEDDICSWLAY